MLRTIADAYQIPENVMISAISFFFSLTKWTICTLMLSIYYQKRRYFPLRFFVVFFLGLVLGFFLSLWSAFDYQTIFASHVVRIITHFILVLYPLFLVCICYQEDFCENSLCWCMTIAISNFTGDSYALILNFFGKDDKTTIFLIPFINAGGNWTIFILYHIVFFTFFAILFAKRYKLQQNRRSSIAVVSICICIILLNNVLGSISRVYEDMLHSPELTILNKILNLTCTAFVLFLATEILRQNKLTQDLLITEHLLFQEKRQYEVTKESIEAINMKCHDLKRRLCALEGRLDEQELSTLKQAIEIYDSNIKTGNQILDVVLYEKQLLCERSHIRLSCTGDGMLLSFLSPSHLYSLLGNALDNAIEAVRQVNDPEKRLIDLFFSATDEHILIETTNYFTGNPRIVDGILHTTKSDQGQHGYGLPSMKYIVSLYHGAMNYEIENDIFFLHIIFPRN